MDIGQEFEMYFENTTAQTSEGSHGMRDYCKWLLKGRKGKDPTTLDSDAAGKANEWYGRCE